MYIPLVLTDSLGRFPNEVSIGNIRYRTPNAKSLSFTSSYLLPFPTYLPCLIYFLVKRKHLRKREAYGWRPLADSSIGRPSPGSLTGENHPSEKHRRSACSFTSKDLRSGLWERSLGNAHWRETEDISASALGHQLQAQTPDQLICEDHWEAQCYCMLRVSPTLHTYRHSSSLEAMGSTVKEREKKLRHCRAPQNIRIRRNPWSQQVQSTHFTEKHMEAHRKGKWGTCREQSGA